MKNARLLIIVISAAAWVTGAAFAAQGGLSANAIAVNPAGANPTVPASGLGGGLGSGLSANPTPVNPSGNLIITGNVVGGSQFRGVVPYNDPTQFESPLGSTSLDSFLKRSAGGDSIYRVPSSTIPYYSRTASVSSASSVLYGLPAPASQSGSDLYPEVGSAPLLASSRAMLGLSTSVPGMRTRPMAIPPEEVEQRLTKELATYTGQKEFGDELEQEGMKKDETGINALKAGQIELIKNLPLKPEYQPQAGQPKEEQARALETGKEQEGAKAISSFEQLRKNLEKQMAEKQQEQAAEQPAPLPGQNLPGQPATEKAQKPLTPEANIPAARPHVNLPVLVETRYNQHIKAGEQFLVAGKFYKAADSFTLASIYKPKEPVAYAGTSVALLGAGEYMSSALYLSRALQIAPAYVNEKVDIAAMVGGRDSLETRLVEVEAYLKRSNAPELEFLISYIYYQIGRMDRAKELITAAQAAMPGSTAVATLKQAIDAAPQTAPSTGTNAPPSTAAPAKPAAPAGANATPDKK